MRRQAQRQFELRVSLRPRSGWTLIELLIVCSMTLLIAGSATFLMAKMLRASHVQADTLVRQRTLHLWESQFRQDVRSAQAAKVMTDDPSKLRVELQQPGGPVTYQVIPDGLERRVRGELGGRWEFGTGDWQFTLLEGDRVIRAEFRRPEVLSLSSNGRMPQGSPDPPKWLRSRVDVALGIPQSGGI